MCTTTGADRTPSHIRLNEDEGIAIVTLDRPEALNALSSEMLHELREVLQEVARREDLQVVILTGAGDRAFAMNAHHDSPVRCGDVAVGAWAIARGSETRVEALSPLLHGLSCLHDHHFD